MSNFLRNKMFVSLAVLVVLGLLIGAAHNSELSSGNSFFLHDVVRSVLAPVNRATHWVASLGGKARNVGRPRSSLLAENARLRKQVQNLTRDNAILRDAAFQNVSLRKALQLKQTSPLKMMAAEVISRNESSWFDSATLDCGGRSGVQLGAAVVNHMGLIGQVTDVDPFTSQITALTDPSSAVGAMVQRSRSFGIIQGRGDEYLWLAYLPKDADVKTGDVVVSSGKGQVVPKGLPVGRVVDVVRNSIAGTTSAVVKPSVHFDQVEHVFVVNLGQAESP